MAQLAAVENEHSSAIATDRHAAIIGHHGSTQAGYSVKVSITAGASVWSHLHRTCVFVNLVDGPPHLAPLFHRVGIDVASFRARLKNKGTIQRAPLAATWCLIRVLHHWRHDASISCFAIIWSLIASH